MKNIVLSFLLLLIIACSSDKNNMHVKGTIKGLKKGTVYLKKANDTAFVIIDSFKVNKAQNYNFEFSTNIEEPEAFTIELDKSTNKDNRITFFGYEGLTTINTSLKNFGYDVSINGSKEQKLLGTEISLVICEDEVTVQENSLDHDAELEEQHSEYDYYNCESTASCGLEDFELLIERWKDFIGYV